MASKLEINGKNSINEDSFIYSNEKEGNKNQYALNKIFPIKNNEGFENNNNQKAEIISQTSSLIDRKKSSESTSISISQTENLSNSSEPSQSIYNTSNFQKIYSNENIQKDLFQEEEMNFFYGVENYFLKLMPEKFSEYKKTKNYLPKNKLKENVKENEKENEKEDEKQVDKKDIESSISESDVNIEENIFNQNLYLQMNNSAYFPIYGNMFYYTYNTFCFNYPFTNLINNENNQIQEKEEGKDIDINIDTNTNNNKFNQIKNINNEKNCYKYKDEQSINEDAYEYEDIYIIKK